MLRESIVIHRTNFPGLIQQVTFQLSHYNPHIMKQQHGAVNRSQTIPLYEI